MQRRRFKNTLTFPDRLKNFADDLKGFAIIDVAHPTIVISDEETVEFRDINDTLRRTEISNRMNALAFAQIDYLDRVVAERANK